MAVLNMRGEQHAMQPSNTTAFPQGSIHFDLTAAMLSLWMLAGLYLDGSAHHHIPDLIETFFTPWHAVLYSGFLASAMLLLITQWRNVSRGYSWTRALPQGYRVSLFGALVFLLSGAADFVWHELFGFEVGLEALVSPSHLTLAVGGILIISAPLRSALHRNRKQTLKGWYALLPVVLSLLGVLSVLTFFTGDFAIITYPNLMVNRPPAENTFFYDMHSLASVLIPSSLLMGVLLSALQHWALPLGSVACIIFGNHLLMTWFHLKEVYGYPQVMLAVLAAALAAEVLYRLLKPSTKSVGSLRLFAFSVPAILFALYFVILITTVGIWWSIHLWTGAVFLSGVVGVLLSYLLVPPEQSSHHA